MNAFDNDKQKCKNFCQGRRLLMFKSCICSITKHSFKLSGPLRFLKFIQNSYLSPRRRCGQRNHFAHREGRQRIPACAQWVRREGGVQKMAERLSTSARTAWRTSPGQVTPLCAKVCTIRVHCPLSLKLLFFRELTPCKLTSARTHALARTRTRAQRRTRTPCFSFLLFCKRLNSH